MVPSQANARNDLPPAERLWTVEEAAAYLHVHPNTVRNRMDDSGLPYERVGRALRFRKADLDEWLSKQSDGDTHATRSA